MGRQCVEPVKPEIFVEVAEPWCEHHRLDPNRTGALVEDTSFPRPVDEIA